ncbi:MAG: flagellar hook-length control protein FliK [Phycisphaerales bacterium]|nr:MAG: flagellar hook-length control protein FliK [Phycisphaerales bacterium]
MAPDIREPTRPAERPTSAPSTVAQTSSDPLTHTLQDQTPTERDATGEERESNGDNRQAGRWALRGEAATTVPAAVARAAQVDAAVRLENATAQAPGAEMTGRATAAVIQHGQMPVDNGGLEGQSNGREEHSAGGARNLAEAPFTARVIRGLTAVINQRGGVMNMRLQPPELGDLRVQMTIARGQVSAQFHVSTAEAHALLNKSMASLRAALESHGLNVERLHVHSPPPSQSQDMRHEDPEQQQQQARGHADAGGGQSRGRSNGDESLNHQTAARKPSDRFAEAFASAPAVAETAGENS